jgi:hypothetical protein
MTGPWRDEASAMAAETIGILLSAATLVVVAAASVAAIVQLNYLRAGNHLSALLEILNQWNLPAVQEAQSELRNVPQKMKDPQYVALLRTPQSVERAKYTEFLALDLWEQIGTYCKYRLIDERILLDITVSQVLTAWRSAEPAIAIIRELGGPSAFENFEYLAVRATLWNRRHPDGAYPARVGRMTSSQ